MAVTCPIGFDVASLRGEVQTMYSRVAASPDGDFHFHRGPEYAVTMLGYDATELAVLPSEVTSSFAGGRVQIADIVIGEILPDSALRDIDLWTG